MGCNAISSVSTAQPVAQNEGGGFASETFPGFAKSAFSAQNQENGAVAQGQQDSGQYAYDYDYAFASSDPDLTEADFNSSLFSNSQFGNSLFNNSAFNNSASNNVVYAYDFQSASS